MGNMGEILREVKQLVGEGYEVFLEKREKNNGVEHQYIRIHDPEMGMGMGISIQMDVILEAIESGEISIQDAAAKINRFYKEKNNMGEVNGITSCLNKDYALENVIYQLVNKEKNRNLLHRSPHKDFLDLAVVYRLIVEEGSNGISSIAVTDEFCGRYSISRGELDAAARRNTVKRGFCRQSLSSLLDLLCNMPENSGEVPMWVLTNLGNFCGAAVMLYKECFSALANELESDLYILPSSIHEVIAVPAMDLKPEFLKETVGEINTSVVSAEEVLSDSVYKYNRNDGTLFIA